MPRRKKSSHEAAPFLSGESASTQGCVDTRLPSRGTAQLYVFRGEYDGYGNVLLYQTDQSFLFSLSGTGTGTIGNHIASGTALFVAQLNETLFTGYSTLMPEDAIFTRDSPENSLQFSYAVESPGS